jgi:Tfp pilus assembly PilM family ATPase
MSRAQTQEVRHLYLAGDSTMLYDLADGLSTATSLAIEVLTPADVIAGNDKTGPATAWLAVMAAALGAGSEL